MKLYLVTVEGDYDDYGSSTFSIGIFDSMDKVKEVIEETAIEINKFFPELEDGVEAIIANYFHIMEFDLNTLYPVRKYEYGYSQRIRTDKYLGGYSE